jgi:hypothetical protein
VACSTQWYVLRVSYRVALWLSEKRLAGDKSLTSGNGALVIDACIVLSANQITALCSPLISNGRMTTINSTM